MTFYVIYENPSDFPGKFVTRQHRTHPVRDDMRLVKVEPDCVVDTLAEARGFVPPGAVNLRRCDQDDPVIREVWC